MDVTIEKSHEETAAQVVVPLSSPTYPKDAEAKILRGNNKVEYALSQLTEADVLEKKGTQHEVVVLKQRIKILWVGETHVRLSWATI